MTRYSLFMLLLAGFLFFEARGQLTKTAIECIEVPLTREKPLIDGALDDPMWENALQLKDFVLTAGESGKAASQRTVCMVGSDREQLYIAFKCFESDIPGIRSGHAIWDDDDILYDDRVAVFLDVNHNHRSYYELTVNPAGIQMDRSGYLHYPGTRTSEWDLGWNCFWRARTSVSEAYWIAEIAIDLKSLGLDTLMQGTTLGFNVARVRQPGVQRGDELAHRSPEFPSEYSAWAMVQDGIWETISNFYDPSQFGDLIFGNKGICIEELGFRRAGFNWGDVSLPSEFGWNSGSMKIHTETGIPPGLKLNVSVLAEDGKIWNSSQKVGQGLKLDQDPDVVQDPNVDQRQLSFTYFVPSDKENRLFLRLLDGQTGELLYETSYTLTVPPFIDFDLETVYTRDPAEIRPLQYRLVTDSLTRASSNLRMTLVGSGNRLILAEERVSDLRNSREFSTAFKTGMLINLEGGNYRINCELSDKESGRLIGYFSQPFTKFERKTPGDFMARRGNYNFGGLAGDAIRVMYPDGNEFVFWRAANYGPWWDLDQAAFNHEHLEVWGAGTQSCCEIMQDRELRYSEVEIVENSPARVVVHWRYALSDSHYRIHMNEWADEYYRFYPDEVVIREVQLWANSNKKHEFFEAIPVKPPGVGNLQLYDKPLATLKTLDGRGYSTDQFWTSDLQFYQDFLGSATDFVFEFNMKERKHPFTVISLRPDILPNVEVEDINLCSPNKYISRGDHRGHWPCSLYPVDGYNSIGNDRPHHGNIGSIKAMSDKDHNPNSWLMMMGLTQEGSREKYVHGHNWLYPVRCESKSKGVSVTGYNSTQRAYEIELTTEEDFVLELDPRKQELLHPVFLLSGCEKAPAYLEINGSEVYDEDVKFGKAADGRWVVYLDQRLDRKSRISFHFNP